MPHRATDKHRYDLGTRLLWLETGFHSLASGFPQHGISPLRRRGHQLLHAEGNSHEPQLLRVGIHTLESLCRHSFHTCWSVHCSLGHSQDIWDWLRADSCWSAVACRDYFPALALLGGIRSAHGNGNQLRHDNSCRHSCYSLVLAGSAASEEERWPSPYPRRDLQVFSLYQ